MGEVRGRRALDRLGSSLGREGPAIHIGAAIASKVAKFWGEGPEARANALCAGSAARTGGGLQQPAGGGDFGAGRNRGQQKPEPVRGAVADGRCSRGERRVLADGWSRGASHQAGHALELAGVVAFPARGGGGGRGRAGAQYLTLRLRNTYTSSGFPSR